MLQNIFNEIEILNYLLQLARKREFAHILQGNRKKAKESGSLNQTLQLEEEEEEERGRKNKRLAKLLDFRLMVVSKKKGRVI